MWRLTDEQRELRAEIRRVVRERIRPRVREIDENCEYPRDLYAVMAEENLLSLSVPREHGGRCVSDVSWCAYVEALAKVSGTVSLMAARADRARSPRRRSRSARPPSNGRSAGPGGVAPANVNCGHRGAGSAASATSSPAHPDKVDAQAIVST